MDTGANAPLPAVIADTGKEMVPAPKKEEEEKDKPLAPSTNLAESGEKPYMPPMTDEERQKIKDLKKLHTLSVEALHEVLEDQKELRKHRDDLLFHRRCLAARLVNRILFRRREAAFLGHQLRLGLKEAVDPLPEELVEAREPLDLSLDMYYVY
ncbi:uncharacterized protein LOC106865556 [Brachypodium distachyon]|uniref:uncharacterized protein LOC106865556 n=1 Tax=Brachypodium distachyon TaxID=15368 RepID=UPI0006E4A5DC|nr:uncharacterized protein LOC106865556 [Brachypodium distachyon]|eukprot:XP_014751252.1 uncharacterized protein LOC106865556 [Brachypodium distachyon]